ncbi:MAG: aminopeptidase, partial [Sphingomonadales bacterium]
MRILALALAALVATPALAQTAPTIAPILTTPEAKDVWTHARPEIARVTHVALDLRVDFASHTLAGSAVLDVLAAPGAKEIVLDIDNIDVQTVSELDGPSLAYQIGPRATAQGLGSALTIQLLPSTKRIRILYNTKPDASALQWLAPDLTAGKAKPYLFSQGQPINNRSWIPTQDSPGIRQTWSATLTVPGDLVAVMSGDRLDGEKGQAKADGTRVYRFRMD